MRPLLARPIASVLRAVLEVAQRGLPFSSDEVREHLEGCGVRVNSAAIGNGIREASLHKWITYVGERASKRKSNHGRKVDLWIFNQNQNPVLDVMKTLGIEWQHYFCEQCNLTLSEPRVTHTSFGNVCPSCGGAVTPT